MAQHSRKARPLRTLAVLAGLVIALFGSIGIGTAAGKTGFLPRFALDLEGGTQMVLTPQASESNLEVTTAQIDQAIEIIRDRVDSSGVAEAEVARQGDSNIVVSIPGNPSQEDLDLVSRSAKMTFRTVLYVTQPTGSQQTWLDRYYPNPDYVEPTEGADDAEGTEGTQGTDVTEETDPAADADGSDTTLGPLPDVIDTGTDPAASPAPTPTSKVDASTGNMPVPPDEAYTYRLTEGLNEESVYAQVAAEYANMLEGAEQTVAEKTATGISEQAAQAQTIADNINCQMAGSARGNDPSDSDKPLVTCDDSGTGAYILGPVMVQGSELTSAANGMATSQQGTTTGQWVVDIEFNSAGGKQFGAVTEELYAACQANAEDPKRQFAIVLDDVVISAPEVCNSSILDGRAQISGSFTQQSSKLLADQLSFGSLPINFQVDSQDQISATAGSEQLEIGLWAGLVGMILVAVYSFFQYRALSLVTVFSLILAIGVSYGTIVLLGWVQGYRLSLAGVAGLIVAIGITADSFIVYFERIRDELRVGRTLSQAVDMAWLRARRTILASDAVNFIAAIVLYMVAVGGVRGFAFTLGLTTVMDLVVVMLFTHPMILLLSKMPFWRDGHPWSGLDPWRLGAPGAVRYVGRGKFAPLPPAAKPSSETADDLAAGSHAEAEEGLAEEEELETAGAVAATALTKGRRTERVPGEAGLSIAERKRRAAERERTDADAEGGEGNG
ncbi:MAG: protein translocase subunit SecD [Bifidobacteriaceae bacterium]|nr:protein translocase subunit SecD [Bifidobacteriaceae bacterium]